ncbi:MAG: DUF934 domain-containing protein [Rhodospirillaceae bacterium]
MTIVNASGDVVEQGWTTVESLEGYGPHHGIIVSPAVLLDSFDEADHVSLSHTGVRLSVEDDVSEIATYVPHLGLIELVFAQFKDGRPYSTALTLRRDYKFTHELRASGDVLPDQAIFLIRSGFSSVDVPDQFTAQEFKKSLMAYSVAYQSAHDSHVSLIDDLRRSTPDVAAE